MACTSAAQGASLLLAGDILTVLDSMPPERQLKARKAIEEVEQEAGWHAPRESKSLQMPCTGAVLRNSKPCLQALDRMELMPDLHELAAFIDKYGLPR